MGKIYCGNSKKELINKRRGCYYITSAGMHATAYFSNRTLKEFKLKIPRATFIARCGDKYFVNRFFAHLSEESAVYSLPAECIPYGEDIDVFLKRILVEKYNVSGDMQFRSVYFGRSFAEDGFLLFDNVCLLYDVDVQKVPEKQHNRYIRFWLTKDEITRLPRRQVSPLVVKYILEESRDVYDKGDFVSNYGVDLPSLRSGIRKLGN